MFGIQFYPTPEDVAYKLIRKLDLSKVKYLLEPSAGSGAFVDAFFKYKKEETIRYTIREYDGNGHYGKFFDVADSKQGVLDIVNDKFDANVSTLEEAKAFFKSIETDDSEYYIDAHETTDTKSIVAVQCVEVDSNLASIVRGKKYSCDNADFLDWCSFSRYDTVLMNPPFADGDKHLLKAISLLENGGQICCILNAETIKNPYTNTRKMLVDKLIEYGADIEYCENAFSHAERKTDVETALIYINIPEKVVDVEVAKNFVKGDIYEKEYKEFSETQLYAGNAIQLLIEQFNLESRYGLKIIDTFNSMKQYIPKDKGEQFSLINLSVIGCADETASGYSDCNRYMRALREKYWTLLFQTNEIAALMTEAARVKYQAKIREFRDYDFTLSNIKQLQIELSQNLNSNVMDAIVELYDRFTYKYSMDNSKNVHMFSGWKHNTGFKVNEKKVIMPLYLYNSYSSYSSWDWYKARDYLTEIEKVLTYLDNGRTDGTGIWQVLADVGYLNHAVKYDGEKVAFKYFDVELKKKGTIHIYWKCPELIKKMTIIGCKHHGTLPNDYGARDYTTSTEEYKEVVNEFEGEKQYADTHEKIEFYNTSSVAMIGMEE